MRTILSFFTICLCGFALYGCATGFVPAEEGADATTDTKMKEADTEASAAETTTPSVTIYFDPNSNELLEDEIIKLDKIAETLFRQPELNLVLNGYTDASGSKKFNRMVSKSRSISAKMYLVGKGIDPLRIDVVGHGATEFVAGNSSEEGRRLNRRVEIDISDGTR